MEIPVSPISWFWACLPFGDENATLLRKALDIMGIPANENLRTGNLKTVNAFRKTLRDDLQNPHNLMIRKEKLTPIPQ
ncbi:hypothetical protein [Dyadobacter aurulentus]|uniref:hypothetical protein n=1 Tax=Dyadobacter sp. UC 10 TaxID=2605428 RepID=UPI0011F3D95A|nr:hypothetical protein [Dyadobacter sp. UC 10]KAA0989056.1 hypothetical protein FXO21_02190 [Dyadobacter sp. UC 10]